MHRFASPPPLCPFPPSLSVPPNLPCHPPAALAAAALRRARAPPVAVAAAASRQQLSPAPPPPPPPPAHLSLPAWRGAGGSPRCARPGSDAPLRGACIQKHLAPPLTTGLSLRIQKHRGLACAPPPPARPSAAARAGSHPPRQRRRDPRTRRTRAWPPQATRLSAPPQSRRRARHRVLPVSHRRLPSITCKSRRLAAPRQRRRSSVESPRRFLSLRRPTQHRRGAVADRHRRLRCPRWPVRAVAALAVRPVASPAVRPAIILAPYRLAVGTCSCTQTQWRNQCPPWPQPLGSTVLSAPPATRSSLLRIVPPSCGRLNNTIFLYEKEAVWYCSWHRGFLDIKDRNIDVNNQRSSTFGVTGN